MNKKRIYVIVEKIHSECDFNVFVYSTKEKAKENFDRLVNYYKENYENIFENRDNYELWNEFLSIYDIVDIEIVDDLLDNNFTY